MRPDPDRTALPGHPEHISGRPIHTTYRDHSKACSLQTKHSGELQSLRVAMDDGARQKAMIDVRVSRMQDDIQDYRRRLLLL